MQNQLNPKRGAYKIEKKFAQAVHHYQLLQPNDKVLVGVSGGKDSLFLLENLVKIVKKLPFEVNVVATHINLQSIPYLADIGYLEQFAQALGVAFYLHEQAPDFSDDSRKTPCYLCSLTRRKALFSVARKFGANKIALGHHLDDALETLLMNMIYNGNISSIPAKFQYHKMPFEMIRPMILLPEKDISRYASERQYKPLLHNCPHEDQTKREKIKQVIRNLETLNPHVRQSLLKSMSKIDPDYLP